MKPDTIADDSGREKYPNQKRESRYKKIDDFKR
jgi:hypothetical protein